MIARTRQPTPAVAVSGLSGTNTSRVLIRTEESAILFDLRAGTLLDRPVAGNAVISADGKWVAADGALISVDREEVEGVCPQEDSEDWPLAIGANRSWVMTPTALLRREGSAYRRVVCPVVPAHPGPPDGYYLPTDVRHAVNQDGSLVATVVGSGTEVIVWSGVSARRLIKIRSAVLENVSATVLHLRFDPSGRRLAISAFDGSTSVYDAQSGELLAHVFLMVGKDDATRRGDKWYAWPTGVTTGRAELAWDRVTDRLASMQQGTVNVSELGGPVIARLEHDIRVAGLTFLSHDLLLTATDNGVLRIWDLKTKAAGLQITLVSKHQWIAVDDKGRFDTNDVEHLGSVRWSAPDEPSTLLPIEAFMRAYFEPNLVQRFFDKALLS